MGCVCEDGANGFISRKFFMCAYTPAEVSAFWIGSLTIVMYCGCLIPQIITNYKRKSGSGLSKKFISLWFFGDVCNMIGCILSKKEAMQIVVISIVVVLDIVVTLQVFYYRYATVGNQATVRRGSSSTSKKKVLALAVFALPTLLLTSGGSKEPSRIHHLRVSRLLRHGMINATVEIRPCQSMVTRQPRETTTGMRVGYALGILSSVVYVGCRFPQLYKNYSRKHVEGLTVSLFLLSLIGNAMYTTSIILGDSSSENVAASAPWTIGLLATIVLDGVILYQFYIYRPSSPLSVSPSAGPATKMPGNHNDIENSDESRNRGNPNQSDDNTDNKMNPWTLPGTIFEDIDSETR